MKPQTIENIIGNQKIAYTSSLRVAQYRKDGDTMYYPKGVKDPDYCVLKFTAESGRWYSNFKSGDFEI
ncbi:MAG: hypothetical protein LBU89_08330 [Fibromonadaceae bacterium]|jgi:general stress protein 26|nr:hypothetical protein [Fibromonadaceae bacterium]